MIRLKSPLAALLLAAGTMVPALAASTAASSASDSIGTSVGSLSVSVEKSSKGSSKATGVAAGDYTVTEVASVADRPGMVRLALQPVAAAAADEGFDLYLPKAVAEQTRLAAGDTIAARQRPYGIEFAQGQPRQAFFLVLTDEWLRELQSTAVVL